MIDSTFPMDSSRSINYTKFTSRSNQKKKTNEIALDDRDSMSAVPVKEKLVNKISKILKNKTLNDLLWLDDENVLQSHISIKNETKDTKMNPIESSRHNKRNELDDSTLIWHHRLENRNSHPREHPIHHAEYMQTLISGILKHTSGGGSITAELLTQFGVKLKVPQIASEFQIHVDNNRDKRKYSVNVNQLTSYIQNGATIVTNDDKSKKEPKEVKKVMSSVDEDQVNMEKFVASIKIKSSNVKKRLKMKSVDAVEELFQMSNERHEREQILSRADGNMDAFLNRGVTMKYNEELDEVIEVCKHVQYYHTTVEAL